MWSLEEIASNKPLTREESISWLNGIKQRPTCCCLREVDTEEVCTFHCFVPCDAQQEICEAREKLKLINNKYEKNN